MPACPDQNQVCVLFWDNPDLDFIEETDEYFTVEIDGKKEDRWKKCFINTDPEDEWLLYLERNALHAFHTKASCNKSLKDAGLVSVWARTTAQDTNYSKGGTTISRLKDKTLPVTEINSPTANVVTKLRKWQY